MVYKHLKMTMPRMDIFKSNAFRLKEGAMHDSIKLSYISDDGAIKEKIEDFEYDDESRVLYLPDYDVDCLKNRRVLVKYEMKIGSTSLPKSKFSD